MCKEIAKNKSKWIEVLTDIILQILAVPTQQSWRKSINKSFHLLTTYQYITAASLQLLVEVIISSRV